MLVVGKSEEGKEQTPKPLRTGHWWPESGEPGLSGAMRITRQEKAVNFYQLWFSIKSPWTF